MIGDLPSIPSNDSSEKACNSSNYSIPEVPDEDLVTGSGCSNFLLSSGGINAICGSADKLSSLNLNNAAGSNGAASQTNANIEQHHLTGSLSNRDRMGTVISNYISEEPCTDTYRISEDSINAVNGL